MTNPILNKRHIPDYAAVTYEHFQEATNLVLEDAKAAFEKLKTEEDCSWDSLVIPFFACVDRVESTLRLMFHLFMVNGTADIVREYNVCAGKLLHFANIIYQEKCLYEKFLKLSTMNLSEIQMRILKNILNKFEVTGVALEREAQAKFNDIQQQLTELSTKFSTNLSKAASDYELIIKDKDTLAGVPAKMLSTMAKAYFQKYPNTDSELQSYESGPWLIDANPQTYMMLMKYADDRGLRKKLYIDKVTRATTGHFNNLPIIVETLKLRHQKAALLGFKSFADLQLCDKDIGSSAHAKQFLETLVSSFHDLAQQDYIKLSEFAKQHQFTDSVCSWDQSYWVQKMKDKVLDVDENILKEFFSYEKCLHGVMNFCRDMFNISFEIDHQTATWHPDVKFYKVYDNMQKLLGYIAIDPFFDAHRKKLGAWNFPMQYAYSNTFNSNLAYTNVVFNFSRPTDEESCLLSFDELKTLFHEFGHAVHHLVSKVEFASISGTNSMERDVIEVPSKFMEFWCEQRQILDQFASHFLDNRKLDDGWYQKISTLSQFRRSSFILEQVRLSLIDIEIHSDISIDNESLLLEKAVTVYQNIRGYCNEYAEYFFGQFDHIFTESYPALYYSYLWSDVYAADLFYSFIENSNDETAQHSQKQSLLEEIFCKGGSVKFTEQFKKFRNREVDPRIFSFLFKNTK